MMFILSFTVSSASEGELLLQRTSNITEEAATPQTSEISQGSYALLTSTPTSGAAQSITPIARTLPRSIRSVENSHNLSRAVSAIDSTTAASRYGMYNHKILLAPHPRLYYLSRYVRLII